MTIALLRTLRALAAPVLFIAVIGLLLYVIGFSYQRLWDAHVQAAIAPGAPNASEERLILTAVVASLGSIAVSLLAALFSSIDRSRVLRTERAKKGYELTTEAAFSMWKAATASYRLLSKAETGSLKTADLKKISANFEDSEKMTLLFEQEVIDLFAQLWGDSEVIGDRIVTEASADAEKQKMIWKEEIEGIFAQHQTLKERLVGTLSA